MFDEDDRQLLEQREIEERQMVIRAKAELSHLFFTRYFFRHRHSHTFIQNWHHMVYEDAIEGVLNGTIKNLLVEVPPGSTKTEIFVVNLIARGLAINPWCRFLHLSGSDQLATLNSATARDLVASEEYQELWPRHIAEDSKAKKRWNVLVSGRVAGGVYATAIGGQVIGFRAGHMAPGFQGALIIDDPNKPEDAFSKSELDKSNRKLLTVVQSRRATEDTPIILVQQRIAENDCAGFIEKGNLPGKWKIIKIPALIDDFYYEKLKPRYKPKVDRTKRDKNGRFSYWPYKEPIEKLNALEKGEGTDQNGSRISRHVYNSQYQQSPVALGGNMIKGHWFFRYKILPKLTSRYIYGDTAQKAKEHNDFSCFGEMGVGKEDGRLYITDWIRKKWEAPDLLRGCIDFWSKCKNKDFDKMGRLRELKVEDKVSGTGLIQTVRLPPYNIPVKGIERHIDKVTRVMDTQPYLEVGLVGLPEDAPWVLDFISECEAFSADMSHDKDDQVDVLCDGVLDLLGEANKLERWKKLAEKG